jgi:hypothetical protein
VYVWVSGFASEGDGPEQASATAKDASVGDGNDIDSIPRHVDARRERSIQRDDGPLHDARQQRQLLQRRGRGWRRQRRRPLQGRAGRQRTCDGEDFQQSGEDNTWGVGGVLYVPCHGAGDHAVTISVRDATVLDRAVKCDAAA